MSILDAADKDLSVLHYAIALQQAASTVGFDWPNVTGIIDKIHEELEEVREEIVAKNHNKLEAEIGDLFFAVANLARHLAIDPEKAIASCNQKFTRRFTFIEQQLAHQGLTPREVPLTKLDSLWEAAKTLD